MMCDDKSCISPLLRNVNEEVEQIVAHEIERSACSAIPQPVMIVGEAGTGKTTLLRRLYTDHKDRHRIWIDGRKVFSTEDITHPLKIDGQSLLFIDDMDYYMSRCSFDEQYRLRRLLFNEGAPMLIASVNAILPSISNYKAPFFEGLRLIYMPEVLPDTVASIFKGKLPRAEKLLALLPPTLESVKLVYEILSLSQDQACDVDNLLGRFENEFNIRYRQLPVTSQHILIVLGKTEEGMTLDNLRETSGLSSGTLTAYLKRLRTLNLIVTDKSIKRKTRYLIKNPLFRLWLSR